MERESEGNSKPTNLFIVLEGGGAKGIAHIAVWDVLQSLVRSRGRELDGPQGQRNFAVAGIAGTSAGAIVAALVAAGANAKDLIDSEGRIPLASVLGVEYFYDLFGLAGWRRLKQFRWLLQPTPTIAGRLTPRWWKSVSSDQALPNSRSRIVTIALGIVALLLLGFVLEFFVFAEPAFAAIAFIIFWIICNICFGVSHTIVKKLERKGRKQNKRHWDDQPGYLFHPFTVFEIALGLTALVEYFLLFPRIPAFEEWPAPTILGPVAYLIAFALACVTVTTFVRRFFKGTVDTASLSIDLNVALATLLTKEPIFNSTTASYDWVTRRGRTETEQGLIGRVQGEPGRWITFRDLEIATGIPLMIVTADVVKNEVQVYGTDSHPNFAVAKAVTASLAIPFAFRPMLIGPRILVDGGVVSSIPAWVYRRHRSRDPDCRILAVGIAPTEFDAWMPFFLAARRARVRHWNRAHAAWVTRLITIWQEPFASLIWPLRFVANVASTAAFGARVVELDASDRLDTFLMHPKFELLDFDKSADQAKMEIENLKEEARLHIENALWKRNEAFQNVCSTIEKDLWTYRDVSGQPRKGARIRIFWAERDGRAESVRIKFTYGFDAEKDLDDRLVMPFRASMTGWAAATKVPHFGNVTVLNEMLEGPMNRYRRFVKWKDLKWCWAIPVVDPDSGTSAGVLSIESDQPMDFFDPILGGEADARVHAWIDPNSGKVRRSQNREVEQPDQPHSVKMGTLEALWAKLVWKDFAELKDPVLPRPSVQPHPPRRRRPLGPRFFYDLEKVSALSVWNSAVGLFKKPISLFRNRVRN
jgi:predicted acylesterase/phospholipase RssA